jgi:thiol-disulfide isomerase/thioredoxin
MIFIMRRLVGLIIVLFLKACFLSSWAAAAGASDKVTLYFFWSSGCPHCVKEKVFLESLEKKYPLLGVKSLEVKNNPENAKLFSDMADAYGIRIKGVPATFIGDLEPLIGYQGDVSTGREIEARIIQCIENRCADPAERLKGPAAPLLSQGGNSGIAGTQGVCGQDVECPEEKTARGGGPPAERNETVVHLPFIGEMDTSGDSLLFQTIVIAGLDGFNPCAFFVLFTLLGLLLHLQTKKRILLVGGIFVFFSGLIYFIFMAAWLNIFLLAGKIEEVTIVAGATALVISLINIKDFFYFGKGVSLVIPEKAKPRLFDRMRRLLKAASLPSVILGTVVLAATANMYELFCTAGFPMVYTRMLTLQSLSKVHYYLYLVLYNVIYVVPLGFIVLFSAATVGAKKLTGRQGQILKLVSGMMMLCLGTVLLVKPELLNNIAVTAGLLAASLAVSGIFILATKRATS